MTPERHDPEDQITFPMTLPGTGERMIYTQETTHDGLRFSLMPETPPDLRMVNPAELERIFTRLFPDPPEIPPDLRMVDPAELERIFAPLFPDPPEIPPVFERNIRGGVGKTHVSMPLEEWPGFLYRSGHINIVSEGPAGGDHQDRPSPSGRTPLPMWGWWVDEHRYLMDPPHHPDYQAPAHDCDSGPAPFEEPGTYTAWAHARRGATAP